VTAPARAQGSEHPNCACREKILGAWLLDPIDGVLAITAL
jgi:hypothetical protein